MTRDPGLIEPDFGTMNLLSWLAAASLLLILVGCAARQMPPSPAPYPHDNGTDIRDM